MVPTAGHSAVQARLIAISALRQEAHLARSIAAGFEQHLVKPLKLQELATVLTSATVAG